jgi:hypothetical protein
MASPWALGAEVRIIGEMHGSEIINVMHFGTNTAVTDAGATNELLLALATAVLACAVEKLIPTVTSDYQLIKVDAKVITGTTHEEAEVQPNQATIGALSPASTSFIATLLNIKTGGGGRSGRGKKFLPPPGETESANSSMSAPTLNLVLEFIACVVGKFVGASATEDWRFGILSQKLYKSSNKNFDTSFREATTITVNPVLAKMGSRKKGRGQ